jgi:hypothetical protein
MEHLVKSDTITFDKATGFFQAGNLHRPATDITQISVKDTDAGTKKLCMQLKDNVVVEIESGKKKVFSGHGTTGRQIEEFDKAIPELVKAAENHAKLWK